MAICALVMKSETPSISVVVAVLNGVDRLERCIDSVATQTYRKKSLIVIDGGSTDGSVRVLSRKQCDINYWVSEKDGGISDAWNKGVAHSIGDWLCFLGADDYLIDTNVLSHAAEHLKTVSRKHRIVYGDVLLMSRDGQPIERSGIEWNVKHFIQRGMIFSHQGVFHHRSLFDEVGLFDTSFRLASDYEWLLRAIDRTDPLYLKGQIIAGMQTGGRSADDSNSLLIISEFARAQRMHHGRIFSWSLWWLKLKVLGKSLLYRILGQRRTAFVIDLYRLLTGRSRRRERHQNHEQIGPE